jgi:hypothetical protein
MKHLTTIAPLATFVLLFIVSILQLSAIQSRIIKTRGWKAFGQRQGISIKTTYWNDLNTVQKIRLWSGLVIFIGVMLFAVGVLVTRAM